MATSQAVRSAMPLGDQTPGRGQQARARNFRQSAIAQHAQPASQFDQRRRRARLHAAFPRHNGGFLFGGGESQL